MTNRLDKLMTVDEVAAYLRVNPMTVYRMVNRGALPGVKVGDLWRFTERDIAAWLARQKRSAKPKRKR